MAVEWVTIGNCRLACGDCREILPTLSPGEVDAVVTDPPYGIGLKTGRTTGGKWANVRHAGVRIAGDDEPFDPSPLLAVGAPMVLWGANFYSDRLPGSGWLVWDKRPGIEDMEWSRSDAELAFISGRKTVKTFRHLWHGLCRGSEVGEHFHPTQKPVALMAWCLAELGVPSGGLVLDPYMGSGTTGVACIRDGFRFVGIEKDPGHFETACRRIRRAVSEAKCDLFAGVA